MYDPAEYAAAMRKAGDAQARELLERVRECLDKERFDRRLHSLGKTEVRYISLLHAPMNSTICYWLSSSFFSS